MALWVAAPDKLDYSFWDKWVQNPDDPVTLAEKQALEEAKEKVQNEEFEKANPDFVKQFKADMVERKKSNAKKQKEAECTCRCCPICPRPRWACALYRSPDRPRRGTCPSQPSRRAATSCSSRGTLTRRSDGTTRRCARRRSTSRC